MDQPTGPRGKAIRDRAVSEAMNRIYDRMGMAALDITNQIVIRVEDAIRGRVDEQVSAQVGDKLRENEQ